MFVIDVQGKQKEYSKDKIINALLRARIEKERAIKIANEIEKKIYPYISTLEIYKLVKKKVEKEKAGFRFNLKFAMKDLGPDGFIFEKFIKKIFEFLKYEVCINQHYKGKCIFHEIDVVAENNKKKYIGECKFRNRTGDRIDVNISMKMFAIIDDLLNKENNNKLKPIIITNEKFTDYAVKYAKCKKIELWGWNYPLGKGLERVIENYRLYPITILPSFNKSNLHYFAENEILLVSDVKEKKDIIIDKIGKRKYNQLLKEVDLLLN